MTRNVVIIQARMDSTRLPGKVLLDLAGNTILSHVFNRCTAIKGIDAVCFAIPEAASSDPVAAEASRLGAMISRGSELDVLKRYNQAAQQPKADTIMRVTSDCPLIDPVVAGQVLKLFNKGNCKFATNNSPPSWPHGLDCEVFSSSLLEEAAAKATKPYEREHVTPWMRNANPNVSVANFAAPQDWHKHRWTLDTLDDYTFFRKLFKHMPNGEASFDCRIPLAIVEANQSLSAINTKEACP
jgi:spore coat polysaccharide biosynthesis protein SpsF